jgi:hypothetical protein
MRVLILDVLRYFAGIALFIFFLWLRLRAWPVRDLGKGGTQTIFGDSQERK